MRHNGLRWRAGGFSAWFFKTILVNGPSALRCCRRKRSPGRGRSGRRQLPYTCWCFRFADNLGRLVFVFFYPFCRMTDFAHFRQSGILLEQRRDFGFVPEQQKTDVGVFPGGDVHPLNDDSRGIISPHRINRYNQIIRQNCAPSSSMTVLVYSAAFLATTSRLSY